MKKILFILIVMLGISSLDVNSARRRLPIDLHKRDIKHRPLSLRDDENLMIECFYQEGVITIEFENPESDAVFTVTDVVTGDNVSTTFNTAMEFNYFIGSEPSTYLLEISTSAGNDYEGYLTID